MKHTIFIIFILFLISASYAKERDVPKEVLKLMKENNCQPISDFFKTRPGVKGAPFVIEVNENNEVEMAAWCQSGSLETRNYKLLIQVSLKSNLLSSCPNKIESVTHIGWLMFAENFAPPERFRLLATQKRLQDDAQISNLVIKSEYDGVGTKYICAGGKWAFFSFH